MMGFQISPSATRMNTGDSEDTASARTGVARRLTPCSVQHQVAVWARWVQLIKRDMGLSNILAVLEPIWKTKTDIASRLRGRLEAILDWATTRGYRSGLSPARWKGHRDTLLPAAHSVANAGHFSALHFTEVGAFMTRLRALLLCGSDKSKQAAEIKRAMAYLEDWHKRGAT